MNKLTLTKEQQLYYLTNQKNPLLMVLLSIGLLPFALMYTRGFFGWLGSIIILSIILGIEQVLVTDFHTLGLVSLSTFVLYFIFTITDANRVNNKLLANLSN